MKRFFVLAVSVAVFFTLTHSAAVEAQAKQGKTQAKTKAMSASGVVKSVSQNSLTITAGGGKEMTFNVDGNTKFIGKGLSTKTREKGKMTAPDSVGMNDRVSVSYHDMNGAMHAETVTITAKSTQKK